MSWLRFDDDYTERVMWDSIGYETRWHYHAMVQMCSRQKRWDGVMPLANARRASDVPDPDFCLTELEACGAIKLGNGTVEMLLVDEHLPSEAVRKNTAEAAGRMRRSRKHKRDNHSLCDEKCPVIKACTERSKNVPRTSGRDGTGRAHQRENNETSFKERYGDNEMTEEEFALLIAAEEDS